MKTRLLLLVLVTALLGGSTGCTTIVNGAFDTLDWVADLTTNAIRLGIGVATMPFDRGEIFKDSTRRLRTTVVQPLVAMGWRNGQPQRTLIIAVCRQPDGSLARSVTEVVDGVVRPTYYDAYFIPRKTPAPEVEAPVSTPKPDGAMGRMIVTDDDTKHVIIDDEKDAIQSDEISELVKLHPKVVPARLSGESIDFLKKLSAAKLPDPSN